MLREPKLSPTMCCRGSEMTQMLLKVLTADPGGENAKLHVGKNIKIRKKRLTIGHTGIKAAQHRDYDVPYCSSQKKKNSVQN